MRRTGGFRSAVLIALLFCTAQRRVHALPPADSIYRQAGTLLAEPRSGAHSLYQLHELIIAVKTLQPDTAFRWTAELARRATKAGNKKMQVFARYHEASLYIITSKRRLAEKAYADGTRMAAEWNLDSLEAMGIAGQGIAVTQQGDYGRGLEYHFRALRMREAQKDEHAVAASFASIGLAYHTAGRTREAELYTDRAISILRTQRFKDQFYIQALHTKANIAGVAGRLAEARRYDSIGLAACREIGKPFFESMFYDNLANCAVVDADYDEAERYFRKCLAIDSAVGSPKQMGDTYLHLGELAELRGHLPHALAYYRRALQLADSAGDIAGAHRIWRVLGPLYRRMGAPDSAYVAAQQAYALHDSLLGESTRAKLDELSTLYETERKERKIQEQSFEISRQQYMLAGGGLLFLAVGGAGWQYTRRQRLRQRLAAEAAIARAREETARSVVLAGEQERSRLGRELHDGVGQVLAAARLNLSALEQKLPPETLEATHLEKATGLLDTAATEMRALAHSMAPEPLVRQGLQKTVFELVRQLQTDRLRITLHSDPMPVLAADAAVTLYRILQECLQNAIRHGKATEIAVTLATEKDHLSLMVEDNGRGFDPLAAAEGIGLANMRTRTAYLGGTLEMDAAPGRGTIVTVHVPVAGPTQQSNR